MTDTCRAAVFLGDRTYEIREFAVPGPAARAARVLQVEAVGLCGSDVAQFEGIEIVPGATAFPVVPGHETVGRVVKLAPDAALGVAEGDRVAVNEILMAPGPLRLYGYSDMTGDGDGRVVGRLRRVHGDLPRYRAASGCPTRCRPSSSRCSSRSPARCTGSRPSASRGRDRRRAGPRAPGPRGARSGAGAAAAPGGRDGHLRRRPPPRRGEGDRCVRGRDGRHRRRGRAGARPARAAPAPTSCSTSPPRPRPSRWRSTSRAAAVGSCSPGSSTSPRSPGWSSDHIVLKSLQLYGGAGFTPQSMATAVALIESGAVRTDVVAGEVFDLDGIDDAMALLQRTATRTRRGARRASSLARERRA